jgi:galactokinase
MYHVQAPGRVNLIGDHTDYTGGDVLPIAIDLKTTLTAEPATAVDVYSEALQEGGRFDPTDFATDGSWLDYLRGVFAVLQDEGHTPGGLHGEIGGDLPISAGLSSSASLELAVIAFLDAVGDLGLSREEMALLGQRAETDYVGVSCGIMDQFAVALGQQGNALHIDTSTLSYEAIGFPTDVRVVIFHTGVERKLTASPYNKRRTTVERALNRVDRETSKAVTEADLATLPELERRRVGFLSRENRRVVAVKDALGDGDIERFGDILQTAHRDIAENYEASCVELDAAVEAAVDAGAYGARLTGAGWGGAVIAIVDAAAASTIVDDIAASYADKFPDRDARSYIVEPTAGVRVEQTS